MGAAKEKFQNKTMIIIVDSDGLIGSLNPTDSHHSLSQTILVKLSERGAKLIYPVTAIAESVTFFQGRLNKPELANQIIQLVKENLLKHSFEIIDTIFKKMVPTSAICVKARPRPD